MILKIPVPDSRRECQLFLYYSNSNCKEGISRCKFFRDFLCQGICLEPFMAICIFFCWRTLMTNFETILIPELFKNSSFRKSRVTVFGEESATWLNKSTMGAYSSTRLSRNAPQQVTVCVSRSYRSV